MSCGWIQIESFNGSANESDSYGEIRSVNFLVQAS